MAIPYVSGPVGIYVASSDTIPTDPFTTSVSPVFLGTAEQFPRIEITPVYEPVYNDLTGSVPYDYSFQGEEATIVADLTRWNEAVYARIVSRPRFTGTRGINTATDVGSLVFTEGLGFSLWLAFPYSSKAPYSANGMPAGYRFFSAFVIGPDTIIPGTRANKRTVLFKAMNVYHASDGTRKLYDHDVTGLPAIPPTATTGSTSSSS